MVNPGSTRSRHPSAGMATAVELGLTFGFEPTIISGAQKALSDSRRYRFGVVSPAAARRQRSRSIKLFGAEQLTQTEESPNLPDFHQEWRRDWPNDATATGSAKAGRPGANSRSEFSGEDGESDLVMLLATLGGERKDYSCHGQQSLILAPPMSRMWTSLSEGGDPRVRVRFRTVRSGL